MTREYPALTLLHRGEVLILEGVQVRKIPGDIADGDWYVGERNTGPKLMTARKVDRELMCIHPVEKQYSYDLYECVRVEVLDLKETA